MGKGSPRRRNAIAGQFAARPIALLESPAYRVLSKAAHQVLSRLEIEHAHHGGRDNGALPLPYAQLVGYGLQRRSIAPAIRELEALGFIRTTRKGCAGNAAWRQPALYRLTYRNAKDEVGDGSHEWRLIETIEQADAIAERARLDANPRAVAAGKKQNPSGIKYPISVAENATETTRVPVA
jgi:hypothetical protein